MLHVNGFKTVNLNCVPLMASGLESSITLLDIDSERVPPAVFFACLILCELRTEVSVPHD